MYLPYKTSDRRIHCAYAVTSGNYSGSIDDEANYVVKFTWNVDDAQELKEKFKTLQWSKDRIFEIVFAESHDGLCERILNPPERQRWLDVYDSMGSSGFTAFVAVRCAYDFVWYELGWRYYKAARTTSDYVLETYDGTFNASCGQIIFLP
ncbi:hypothetical protein AAVH_23703 [Aphelenchoides avenae]|nr:hypothetical protein AAVH_23703 [Aphelenchus avenae]